MNDLAVVDTVMAAAEVLHVAASPECHSAEGQLSRASVNFSSGPQAQIEMLV